MAINSSTKKVVSKKLLKIVNTKVQVSTLVDEQIGLDKVLDVFCQPTITSSEMIGEYLQMVGKVMFRITILGLNKVYETVQDVTEFSERLQLGSYENVFVVPTIRNVQYKKSGTNLLDTICNVELGVYGVVVDEITPITLGNENCVEKTNKLSTQVITAKTNDKFNFNEEIELTDKIDKLLMNVCRLSNVRVVPNDNYAKIEGIVEVDLTYLSNDSIKHAVKTIDFVQELSILNLKNADVIDDTILLDGFEIQFNAIDEQNKTAIRVSCTIGANIFAYSQEEVDVIVDMFSLSKQITCSTECFNNIKYLKKYNSSERVNVTLDMKDSKRMDEILFVGEPILNIIQSQIENDVVNVTATILQNIVYKNYDTEEVCSNKFEIPASANILVQDNIPDAEIVYTVKCNSYKNKVGKEIDFNYELVYEIKTFQKTFDCFVSKVEELSELPRIESSIVVYMPNEGDDLYKIAKDLRITPDIILAQNPNYNETENNKIVVYLQKK